MFSSPITSHKADSFDLRIVANGIHGGHSTMDDIENTRGKAFNGGFRLHTIIYITE
jgi:hypothetical protein